ncbi:hypothetical protein PFISCL1PPCAC_26702, partial [Pristionchus fissidentatus]
NQATLLNRENIYSHSNMQTNGICDGCNGTALDRLKMKVTDFGLTRESEYVSNKKHARGTPGWISPEVFKHLKYSEKSDVWSFGVLLWVLVSREMPHKNVEFVDFKVSSGNLKLKTTEEFPAPLSDIIEKCFDMDPEIRPDFRGIRKMLDPYMEELHRKAREENEDEFIDVKKLKTNLNGDNSEISSSSMQDCLAELDCELRGKEKLEKQMRENDTEEENKSDEGNDKYSRLARYHVVNPCYKPYQLNDSPCDNSASSHSNSEETAKSKIN